MLPSVEALSSLLLWALVAALAATTFIRLWLESSLFASQRAWMENIRDAEYENPTFNEKLSRSLGELSLCPFCLSYHVAAWAAVAAWHMDIAMFGWFGFLISFPGFVLIHRLTFELGHALKPVNMTAIANHLCWSYSVAVITVIVCFITGKTLADLGLCGAATVLAVAMTHVLQRILEVPDSTPE